MKGRKWRRRSFYVRWEGLRVQLYPSLDFAGVADDGPLVAASGRPVWIAKVYGPDLSAEGDTPDEALANLRPRLERYVRREGPAELARIAVAVAETGRALDHPRPRIRPRGWGLRFPSIDRSPDRRARYPGGVLLEPVAVVDVQWPPHFGIELASMANTYETTADYRRSLVSLYFWSPA